MKMTSVSGIEKTMCRANSVIYSYLARRNNGRVLKLYVHNSPF